MQSRKPTHRVLVLIDGDAETSPLLELLRSSGATQVLVVAPALNGRLGHSANDDRLAREVAESRLYIFLSRLEAADFVVEGMIGDADPVLAAEDALRLFPADEVVVVGGSATSPLARCLPQRAQLLDAA